MNNRKDIDSIYREWMINAEITPPEEAWINILSRLPQKKRRVFSGWYLISGIAAAIAIIFILSLESPHSGTGEESISNTDPVEKIREKILSATIHFDQQMSFSSLLLADLQKISSQKQEFQNMHGTEDSHRFFRLNFDIPGDLEVEKRTYSSKDFPEPVISEQEVVVQEENFLSLPVEEELNITGLEVEKRKQRFSLTTKVAPVFFDNFGKGNPLDEQFAQSKSGGELSLSYGINLAYELFDKVKVRSGVSKVDLAYQTNQISFNDYLSATSGKRPEIMGTTLASPVKGELNQNLTFIEVPLEVQYVILDRRVGINIIGGASAYFLDRNDISLDSETSSDDLGRASNINNLSFSTNVGLGFDYDFSKYFGMSLEPVLKLQMNTFKDVQGLHPYYFGIYSGLNYRF